MFYFHYNPSTPPQPFFVFHYIRCYFQNQSFHITFLISSLFLLLLSSLNDSQYDGKVIAGEEALNKLEKFLAQRCEQIQTKKQKKNDDNKRNDETIVDEVSKLPVVNQVESASDQVPNPVDTEQECLNETATVQLNASVSVMDEVENTSDQVPNHVETEQECLNETATVQLNASVPVMDEVENTSDQVPYPVESEQECLNETATVQLNASVPVMDEVESTSDQVPNHVETEQECLNETATVQLNASVPVMDEVENTSIKYQIMWKLSKNVSTRPRLCSSTHPSQSWMK
ncbi:uncharacterized protein LOC114960687 [Acropora millepora]|uniref:uncharacterized protein LOC114960687 n=1 Tax=Acropora millepora TaxID=45264 RepID=UPI001CF30D58|nr:uncharacterized protein LOC114960687 [Acropora millepora]